MFKINCFKSYAPREATCKICGKSLCYLTLHHEVLFFSFYPSWRRRQFITIDRQSLVAIGEEGPRQQREKGRHPHIQPVIHTVLNTCQWLYPDHPPVITTCSQRTLCFPLCHFSVFVVFIFPFCRRTSMCTQNQVFLFLNKSFSFVNAHCSAPQVWLSLFLKLPCILGLEALLSKFLHVLLTYVMQKNRSEIDFFSIPIYVLLPLY